MRTKSYKIYTDETGASGILEAHETLGYEAIKLTILGHGSITLPYEAWKELMRLEYHLKCNSPDLPGQADDVLEPPLELPTDKLKKEIETNDD